MSEVEQRFAARFPGAIARFSDGERVIVLRHVERPTRMLHPAADCFRGLGYAHAARGSNMTRSSGCGAEAGPLLRNADQDGGEGWLRGYPTRLPETNPRTPDQEGADRSPAPPDAELHHAAGLREFRVKNSAEYKVGQKILSDMFIVGEFVDIEGTSKGRGFQGGVKRYNFRGGPRTHGQSDRLPRAH